MAEAATPGPPRSSWLVASTPSQVDGLALNFDAPGASGAGGAKRRLAAAVSSLEGNTWDGGVVVLDAPDAPGSREVAAAGVPPPVPKHTLLSVDCGVTSVRWLRDNKVVIGCDSGDVQVSVRTGCPQLLPWTLSREPLCTPPSSPLGCCSLSLLCICYLHVMEGGGGWGGGDGSVCVEWTADGLVCVRVCVHASVYGRVHGHQVLPGSASPAPAERYLGHLNCVSCVDVLYDSPSAFRIASASWDLGYVPALPRALAKCLRALRPAHVCVRVAAACSPRVGGWVGGWVVLAAALPSSLP
jgi:hypothetical protein